MSDRKFDLIVFDLDGTLFNTKWTILEALDGFVKYKGLKKLTEEELESFFGPPAAISFKKYFNDISDKEREELLYEYRNYYMENTLLKAKPYDGTEDVLKELKNRGFKIALATYKLMRCVTPLIEHYGYNKYFDSIKGSVAELGSTKTQIMKDAINECKISDNNRICMIGDTEHDFGGARNLEVAFIGMNYAGNFDTLTDEQKNYKKFVGICNKAIEILDKV